MEENFDFDDIEEEEYTEAVERSTGSRKKTAAYILGGAALGALVGDIFYGRDVAVSADFSVGNGIFNEAYSSGVSGHDTGGIIEDLIQSDFIGGEPILNDNFDYISVHTSYVYDFNTGADIMIGNPDIHVSTLDEVGVENYLDAIESMETPVFMTHDVTPDGAMIGGGTGAVGGLGADYTEKKIRKARESQ